MSIEVLSFPNTLNDDGALSLVNDLNQIINIPDIGIDFRNLNFVFPFGTLVAAEALKTFVKKRSENSLKTYYIDHDGLVRKSSGPISYLKFFGFFDYCGLPLGNAHNRTYHTQSYIPIQTIQQSDLEHGMIFGSWRQRIERKCKEISALITNDDFVANYLEYAFREIIRNVFEHSGIDSCSLMAQSYRDGKIEIAVADRGIGIHESLSDKYEVSNALEALNLSLEPGISKADIENAKGNWGNSGFGLYLLSGIGKQYGEFSVLSSGTYLKKYEEDQKTLINENIFYNGTVIKISVYKKDLVYFPNLLQKLINEGEDLLYKKYGRRILASGKSKSASLGI